MTHNITKPYCTLTMPLRAELHHLHLLDKRFKIAEQIKNDLITYELHRLHKLERLHQYRDLMTHLNEAAPEERKALSAERTQMLREAGFTRFDFLKTISPMREHFVQHIQAQIADALATDVWRAFEAYLYGNGEEVHLHPRNTLASVYCPKAGVGMHYKNGVFEWHGGRCEHTINIKVPVQAPRNDYEREMLAKPIVALRVTRKWMKTRYKYYLQFILEGTPPPKKRKIGKGRVGIDLGTKTAAIVSSDEAKTVELADRVNKYSAQKAELSRKMDASRRAMNPYNYFSDGTIKPKELCRPWVRSKHYLRYAAKVRDINRKAAATRRYQHNCLANEIISMGDEFYIEDKSFAKLAQSQHRVGREIFNRAPALLVTILDWKLRCLGASCYRLNVFEYKARRYDHVSDTYCDAKSSKSDTVTLANGDVVQRNLYAAFVLMCADKGTKKPDNQLCRAKYEQFLVNHDAELERRAQAVS